MREVSHLALGQIHTYDILYFLHHKFKHTYTYTFIHLYIAISCTPSPPFQYLVLEVWIPLRLLLLKPLLYPVYPVYIMAMHNVYIFFPFHRERWDTLSNLETVILLNTFENTHWRKVEQMQPV